MTMNQRAVAVVQDAVPFDKLPKKQQAFVEHFVRCGDAKEAYLAAGYTPSPNLLAPKAGTMRRELIAYISEKLGEYVTSVDMAALAVNNIRDLMANSPSDAVRLAAAKEILSRGGWDIPKEVTINHNVKHLSDEEIEVRIRRLQAELMPDMRPAIEVFQEE
jgi:phage terminase small subunit